MRGLNLLFCLVTAKTLNTKCIEDENCDDIEEEYYGGYYKSSKENVSWLNRELFWRNTKTNILWPYSMAYQFSSNLGHFLVRLSRVCFNFENEFHWWYWSDNRGCYGSCRCVRWKRKRKRSKIYLPKQYNGSSFVFNDSSGPILHRWWKYGRPCKANEEKFKPALE